MKSDIERLIKHAKCGGLSTQQFFEDCWFHNEIPFTDALNEARAVCDGCPVRWECLKVALASEAGTAETHRAGVYAGMTASQRYSLERRKAPTSCPECGEAFDPIQLRVGDLECPFCTFKAEMEAIPDRGDDWAPRHTLLATAVLTWLIDNVDAGEEVPTVGKLARIVNARVNDLRRVYSALADDHIIVRISGNRLVRHASAASAVGWVPAHLRIRQA